MEIIFSTKAQAHKFLDQNPTLPGKVQKSMLGIILQKWYKSVKCSAKTTHCMKTQLFFYHAGLPLRYRENVADCVVMNEL